MSILDAVKQGVEIAFTVGAEFVTVGTYHKREGNGTYDPDTDTTSPGTVPLSPVRFLKTAADVTEREASPVAISDVKFLVPASDLPSGFKPGDTDQMSPGDGVLYNVVTSKFVPGESIHIIFGRKA